MPKFTVAGEVTIKLITLVQLEVEAKDAESAEKAVRDLWSDRDLAKLEELHPHGGELLAEGDSWWEPEIWNGLEVFSVTESDED